MSNDTQTWRDKFRQQLRTWSDMDALVSEGNEFAEVHRDVMETEIVAMVIERSGLLPANPEQKQDKENA